MFVVTITVGILGGISSPVVVMITLGILGGNLNHVCFHDNSWHTRRAMESRWLSR